MTELEYTDLVLDLVGAEMKRRGIETFRFTTRTLSFTKHFDYVIEIQGATTLTLRPMGSWESIGAVDLANPIWDQQFMKLVNSQI